MRDGAEGKGNWIGIPLSGGRNFLRENVLVLYQNLIGGDVLAVLLHWTVLSVASMILPKEWGWSIKVFR